MARLEFLFSLFGLAAVSAFWLAAAFFVTPGQFGEMAKLQAIIMLVVATLSLRTYDLSFFLLRQHGQSVTSAFKRAFTVELALFVVCAACVLVGLAFIPAELSEIAGGIDGQFAALAGVLAAAPVLQGSTQALLRQQNRDIQVALADLAGGFAFAVATGTIMLAPNRPEFIILLWLGAAAVRPLTLVVVSMMVRNRVAAGEQATEGPSPSWRAIAKFLALGQLTNVVKNNGPSIELMILGAFVGPASVAVFRVARSFLQLSVVLINIVYQRAFRGLAKLAPNDDRGPTIRRINRNSLLAWLASLPLIGAGGAAFVYLNPHQVYSELWTALPIFVLATLPTALQQAQFADLAISGRYVAINLSYLAGMAVLAGLCWVTGGMLSVQLFASWLFVANLTRLAVMHMLLPATKRAS